MSEIGDWILEIGELLYWRVYTKWNVIIHTITTETTEIFEYIFYISYFFVQSPVLPGASVAH